MEEKPGDEALLFLGGGVSRLWAPGCGYWAQSKERRWHWILLTLKKVTGAEVESEVV